MAAVTVPLGPASVNIAGVRAGDRNQITMTLTRSGTPIDLTGQTVTAQARRNAIDEDGALDAVVDVTGPGALTIRWPGQAVRDWLGGKSSLKGVWDLQATSGSSDPVTMVAGSFEAVMDVTR